MDTLTLQDRQELDRKKKYLKRYRRNSALVNRLTLKLAALDDRIISLRSPSMSGMPRGGDPVTMSDLIADKADLEARIQRLKGKGRKLRSDIAGRIDELEDPRYAAVLEAFMLDGMDFDEIAKDMGYTERHVKRLYSEAILSVSLECH